MFHLLYFQSFFDLVVVFIGTPSPGQDVASHLALPENHPEAPLISGVSSDFVYIDLHHEAVADELRCISPCSATTAQVRASPGILYSVMIDEYLERYRAVCCVIDLDSQSLTCYLGGWHWPVFYPSPSSESAQARFHLRSSEMPSGLT